MRPGVCSLNWLIAYWPVSRRRHRMLAEDFLVCRERQMYVEKLLGEAEANHTDQQLHWWAWWELYRTFEVPREERTHDARPSTDPDPGAALPALGPHDHAHCDRTDSGGLFDFPL